MIATTVKVAASMPRSEFPDWWVKLERPSGMMNFKIYGESTLFPFHC